MVGIVCFLSTRYAQFAYKYINILEKNNIEYEFVFWNREGDYNGNDPRWIPYNEEINSFQPFYKKIFGFIKFSKFMRKKIKERKYDKLIVLTSQTAIPLVDILLTKYKNNYIYDYRDVTYENIKLYKYFINKLICNSKFTAISSEGFLKNFNKEAREKTVISHNTREFDFINIEKSKSDKIRIVYWGMVRQLEFNYRICDLFSNDERFELYYHGAGYHKELEKYCKNRNYNNIFFTGRYSLDDIKEFAKNTDIILNLYENDRRQKNAITVKFYDSIQYSIPMMVLSESYMAELVKKYSIGYVLNGIEKENLDNLYDEYRKYNYYQYKENVKLLKKRIDEDNISFQYKLLDALNN